MIGLMKILRARKAAFDERSRRFVNDERGATAIEYGLIIALIFLAIVGAVRNYADATNTMYSDISSTLD